MHHEDIKICYVNWDRWNSDGETVKQKFDYDTSQSLNEWVSLVYQWSNVIMSTERPKSKNYGQEFGFTWKIKVR